MLNELSLFSGYGGFSLGLKLAKIETRCVGYVEIDEYCQQLIQARIRDGFLDWAPIIRDIKTTDFRSMAGLVDIVTAGFPCQPHSVAGQRRGEADERNLWPDTLRVVREVGPKYVLLENVPGLGSPTRLRLIVLKVLRQLSLFDQGDNQSGSGRIGRSIVKALGVPYMGRIIGQLAEIGYDCLWDCVPAAAIGAPHLRWRWWCLAYAAGNGLQGGGTSIQDDGHAGEDRGSELTRSTPGIDPVGNPPSVHVQGFNTGQGQRESGGEGWWATEPDVGRVADGVAYRVDRLKALGNGIVPAVVARFLRT